MNYLASENYQAINEKLSNSFSQALGSNLKVRIYQNNLLAGYDICFSLLQFLSHRPKVGMIRNGSSLPEFVLPQMYRLQTPLLFKKQNETFLQYAATLDHEVNFVIWSSENEITGEILLSEDARKEIHAKLSSQRIYSVEIKSSFLKSDADILNQSNYAVIIQSGTLFSAKPCLVFHTEKLKTPTLIGTFQQSFTEIIDVTDVTDNISAPFDHQVDHQGIEMLDQHKLSYFFQFATQPRRLQDRYVLQSKIVSGSALKEEMKLLSNQAFAPSELPTWVLESFQNWWPEASHPDLLRGLLVLNLAQLKCEDFQKILETHDQLSQQSVWSV